MCTAEKTDFKNEGSKSVDIVTDGVKLGGIVGALDYTKEMTGRVLENCWFAGSITGEKARQSGGIVGTVIGNSKADVNYTLKNCLFTGYVGNDRVPKSGEHHSRCIESHSDGVAFSCRL